MLDHLGKGFVSTADLSDSLKNILNVDGVTQSDIFLFFRRYDTNADGRLTFSEFCNAATPLSKEYAALLTSRPDFYSSKTQRVPTQEFFNPETRQEFRNLWHAFFQAERASECLRVRISKRPMFTYRNAFAYCDKDQDGALSSNDIREMLSEHGFFATERELNSIMNKFDRDRDQKIIYTEFIEEMTPKLSQ